MYMCIGETKKKKSFVNFEKVEKKNRKRSKDEIAQVLNQ